MKNLDKKQQAQFLYMAQGKTQKEIADAVGVSERTVYAWIHQYAWDKLRLASFQAPATIADNLCSQLVELQNSIAARPVGNRFPTPQEAEVSRKLVMSLEKMKKYPGLSQNMQVLETFRNYIKTINKDLARNLGDHISNFLSAESVNGYAPYQMEYGVDPIAPFAPFMEESDEADEQPAEQHHCPGNDICIHAPKCTYPDCNSLSKRKVDIVAAFHIPPIHYARQWAERIIAANTAPVVTGSIPAIAEQANEVLELPPAPEEFGSISAIPIPDNESVSQSVDPLICDPDNPEETGSIPAIFTLENDRILPSVESLNPCKSVILTNEKTPEETGSNPAISVIENDTENNGYPRAA